MCRKPGRVSSAANEMIKKKALQKSNSECKSSQFNLAFVFEEALLCQSLTQNECLGELNTVKKNLRGKSGRANG